MQPNPNPSTSLKHLRFILRPFCLSSSAIVGVSVRYVWAKTVLPPPQWPREATPLDTPVPSLIPAQHPLHPAVFITHGLQTHFPHLTRDRWGRVFTLPHTITVDVQATTGLRPGRPGSSENFSLARGPPPEPDTQQEAEVTLVGRGHVKQA